ncbi:MAG: hypothetical protein Ct9H300mP12_03280 [Acidimicrobiales bacterium]|nr:MAG: hypothetical protein Ct9H300mP12_03280 [Acidimicrobiales bacterium]
MSGKPPPRTPSGTAGTWRTAPPGRRVSEKGPFWGGHRRRAFRLVGAAQNTRPRLVSTTTRTFGSVSTAPRPRPVRPQTQRSGRCVLLVSQSHRKPRRRGPRRPVSSPRAPSEPPRVGSGGRRTGKCLGPEHPVPGGLSRDCQRSVIDVTTLRHDQAEILGRAATTSVASPGPQGHEHPTRHPVPRRSVPRGPSIRRFAYDHPRVMTPSWATCRRRSVAGR